MLPAGSVKASIVIPCFNHGQYLREALASALLSDFDDYEVVVVDDGSTDEATLSIIEELKSQLRDRQNLFFIRQENQGPSVARNNGIRAARGEYILPLDADDRISPHFLRKAADILDNNPRVGVVYAYVKYIGDKDGLLECPVFDAQKLLLNNFVAGCSVFRRLVWEDCSGYDPNLAIGYEDWDLWIGAMERGWMFHLIKEVLFEYRIVNGSRNMSCNIPENRRELIKYICNKHRDTYINNLGYVISEKDVTMLDAWQQAEELDRWSADLEKRLSVAEAETRKWWQNAQDVWRQAEEAGRWSADLEKRLSVAEAEAQHLWQDAQQWWGRQAETNQRLMGKEQFIAALLHSRSFRIGRAFTWPVRKLMGKNREREKET